MALIAGVSSAFSPPAARADNVAAQFPGAAQAAWTVAANPVTNKAYIGYRNSSIVTVFGPTSANTHSVTVGNGPRAIAVDPTANLVFVANEFASSVSILDGTTDLVVATVPIGTSPMAIGVQPLTRKLYVSATGHVSVIDEATRAVVATIPIAGGNLAVSVNAETNRIYVSNLSSNAVSVIDGTSDTLVATVPGLALPWALVMNPVTNKLYVANANADSVSVVDGTRDTIVSTVAVGHNPNGIALNPMLNRLYVTNYNSNSLSLIDGATDAVTGTVATGAAPYAVAVNQMTGKVYVGNYSASSTSIFSATGSVLGTLSAPPGPAAIAVNPVTDRIFAAGQNSPFYDVYDGGNASAQSPVGFGGPSAPTAIAVNTGADKIYVVDVANRLMSIDGPTKAITSVAVGQTPVAVAFNPVTNTIYVANSGSSDVSVIDASTLSLTATVPTCAQPKAIAINRAANRIFVACSGAFLYTIDGLTNATTQVNLGLLPQAIYIDEAGDRVDVTGNNALSTFTTAGQFAGGVGVGASPQGIAVVGSTIYTTNRSSNTVSVVTNSIVTKTINVGTAPVGITVNPRTRLAYVSNTGSGTVSVIDTGSNTVVLTLSVGATPGVSVLDEVGNKLYVPLGGTSQMAVIDGAYNSVSLFGMTGPLSAVAVNPLTHTAYGIGAFSSFAQGLTEQVDLASPLQVAVTPLPGNITKGRMKITVSASSAFAPNAPVITGVAFQVDSAHGAWTLATPNGDGTYLATLPASQVGLGTHTIYAYALDTQAATLTDGFGDGRVVSKVAGYTFALVPPSVSVVGVTNGATYELGSVPDASCLLEGTTPFSGGAGVVTGPFSQYGLGLQSYSCSYFESGALAGTASATYQIVDTRRPVLPQPDDFVAEATAPSGAVTNYPLPVATDPNGFATTTTCSPARNTTFPFGSTPVSCVAMTAFGLRSNTVDFTVMVVDRTAPTLPPLTDLMVSVGPDGTAPVSYSVAPSATDAVDGTDPVTCMPGSGTTTVAAHASVTVSCTATDQAGNTSTGTFTVTGVDVDAPVVSVPANTTYEATSAGGAAVSFVVSVTDNVDQNLAPSCSAVSGAVFGLGGTTVTCSATDTSGNTSTNTFVVTVLDTTAPVVSVPSAVTAEATSGSGATVTYAASTAHDVVDGDLVPTCSPASGDQFGLGVTSVACVVADAHGNTASTSFLVNVVDTTAAVLDAAPDVLTYATSASGATVLYTAPNATDAVDGVFASTCSPAAGSVFPIGSTTVTCTATDAHGNTSSETFTVLVKYAMTSTAVTSSANPSAAGHAVTFSATVSSVAGTPTGSVQFSDGSDTLGSPVALNANGVAVLTTSSLAAGTHAIAASYSGAPGFAPSSTSLSQVVTKTGVDVAAKPSVLNLSGPTVTLKLSARLVAKTGGAIEGRTMAFVANGKVICSAVTNAKGDASCGGTYPGTAKSIVGLGYTATFSGDAAYLAGSGDGPIVGA